MDIAHLHDFIAVVDTGSLTQAATQLHMSQPAVSQRMTQLERELKVRLLDRGPRGVEPTQAGRTLYRDSQHLVRQFNQLPRTVASQRDDVHGSVAVGLPSAAAAYLAPALYSWSRRHHPGIHLHLFESMSGYIQELLLRGRIDLALLYRDDASPHPAETPLYAEDLYVVGDLGPMVESGRSSVALRELEGVPLVAPGGRSNLRALIERMFAARGLVPNIVADIESLGAMVRLAEDREACAILPLSSVGETATPARRIVEPVIERYVAACTVADFFEPRDAVAAVRRGIAQVIASLAAADQWPGVRPVTAGVGG